MIIDNLKNCELYYGVNKRFEKAFDFIKKACGDKLPVGKYEIDGSNLYALVQEYNTKSPEVARFEAHRKYIDIQYIISGNEKMELMDISKATPETDYNDEKDVIFFENTAGATLGIFSDEQYAIFFPQDVHKPGISIGKDSTVVRKIVVKIAID